METTLKKEDTRVLKEIKQKFKEIKQKFKDKKYQENGEPTLHNNNADIFPPGIA